MNIHSHGMTRKELIVEKAIELFAMEGFENTSVQRLAEVSGVAQGLLYRHFRNKNDLLFHLLMMGLEQIAETLQPYLDNNIEIREVLEAHVRLTFSLIKGNRKLWKVLHGVRHNQALLVATGIKIEISETVIIPVSSRLQKEGIADAELAAWFILSTIDGMVGQYLLYPDEFPLEKMEKFLIHKIQTYAEDSKKSTQK
jgi:AcrR family transcriptional regulator